MKSMIRVHRLNADRVVTGTSVRWVEPIDETETLRNIAFGYPCDRIAVTVNGDYVPLSRDWFAE